MNTTAPFYLIQESPLLNKGQEIQLTLECEDIGASLQSFLLRRSHWFPGNNWRESLERYNLFVDGKPAELEQRLTRGQKVHLFRKPWREPEVPRNIGLVFENQNLLIVDKPAGIPVLAQGDYLENTLLHLLRSKTGNRELTPGHRLDMETSGLLMLTKQVSARGWFQSQFQRRVVLKNYEALVFGHWPQSQRRIEMALARDGLIYTKFVANETGKFARTDVLAATHTGNYTWLFLRPITGRTHQIRAHLAASGHAIVGDKKYYADPQVFLDWVANRDWSALADRLLLRRQALHCRTLGCHLTDGTWRQWRSRREMRQAWLSELAAPHH